MVSSTQKEVALEILKRQAQADLEVSRQQSDLAAAARQRINPFLKLFRFPEKRLVEEEERAKRLQDDAAKRQQIIDGITDFHYVELPKYDSWFAIVHANGQRIQIEDRVIGTTKIDFVGNLHLHHDTVARIDGKPVTRKEAYLLELIYVPLVRQLTALANSTY